MKKIFFTISLLLLTLGFVACSDNDDESQGDVGSLSEAPASLVEKADMPTWLGDMVENYEKEGVALVRVYQGTWKGESIYYIDNPLNSCVYCTFYDAQGRLYADENMTEGFVQMKTWKLIYIVQMPTIVGDWYLMERAKGFSQPIQPDINDIVCSFGVDGTVTVKNNTNIVYHDRFMDNGKMNYACDDATHTLTIDDITFGYSIENNLLIISDKAYVDGARYTFAKKRR